MAQPLRAKLIATSLALLFCLPLVLTYTSFPPLARLHFKLYDAFARLEYRLKAVPKSTGEIVLVAIDNETLRSMPQRWPYPRRDFTQVIINLARAKPSAIAFDFVFSGESSPIEDDALAAALKANSVIMASHINETGELQTPEYGPEKNYPLCGIITKLQDSDSVVRRNLLYMVAEENKNQGFLSWEMKLLESSRKIDLATFKPEERLVTFKSASGEVWRIPVEKKTKSYNIHFRAHTKDFKRISFSQALKGNFQEDLIRDKIVLVGLVSSVLGDIHNTPLGWLPGLTLNANAFLSLDSRDFLKDAGPLIDVTLAMIAALSCAVFGLYLTSRKADLAAGGLIGLFLLSGFLLYANGLVLNYALLPCCLIAARLSARLSGKLLYLLH